MQCSKPFLLAALAEFSAVLLAQLDKILPKESTMAIVNKIRAMEDGHNPFAMGNKEFESALNITTAQQDIVKDLSPWGTP